MAAYDSYKDSGVKWLGKVPRHWEILPGKAVFSENKVKNDNNTEKFVLSLSYGRITPKKDLTEGLVPENYSAYQIVEPGYIIIRCTDLQNDKVSLRTGFVKNHGIISGAYLGLKTKSCFLSQYMHLLLHVWDITKELYRYGSGLRQSLSWNDIKYLNIPIPPREEQEAIVSYLDNVTAKIDEAIEAQQKMIDALNERKQIIITRAVTKGLNPDAPLRDSGIDWLGQIPAHWEIVRASFVFPCIGSGSTPSSGNEKYYSLSPGYPWIQTGDLNDNILNTASKYITEKAMKDVRLYVYPKGSIIVAMYGATIGKTSLVNFATTVNQACCVLPPNKKCLSQFALYYFQASKSILLQSANGGGQPNINQQLIRRHKILIPPFNEQSEICEYINRQTKALNKSIINCEQMISLLQERKQIIINEVVTGKKKVI
ncbi:MAG: restriction endonuclease subunit S [Sodaliphilus sp.]|nr:restriction endonuclease subunit S [Sodaliphilus sp.]